MQTSKNEDETPNEISLSNLQEISSTSVIEDLEKKNLKTNNEKPEKEKILSEKLFIILISFSHGLYYMADLAVFLYQKDTLKMEPHTIQLVKGIVGIPWCIKPVFGYLSDKIISKFGKSKNIIYITCIIRFFLYVLITLCNLRPLVFYVVITLIMTMHVMENVIAEYLLVLKTQQENKKNEGKGTKANQLPIYFGFRATGTLIGNFFSGRIIHAYSVQTVFFICSLFAFPVMILCYCFKEDCKKDKTVKKTFKKELKIMKKLIFRDKVFKLIIFIFLINLTPDFTMLVTFYLTDHLHFTPKDLSNFNTFATFSYIVGLLLYSFCFKNVNPKKFYLGTNFIYWMANLTFLFVVFDLVKAWGLSNKIFCILSQGFSSLIGELNFMPILAIWCTLCPKNLEATSITVFTGFINLSSGLSNYFGAFLIWVLNIHKTDYNKLWIPIVIQNSYLLVLIIGILFIEFPDVTQKNKNEYQNPNDKKKIEGTEKLPQNKSDPSLLID